MLLHGHIHFRGFKSLSFFYRRVNRPTDRRANILEGQQTDRPGGKQTNRSEGQETGAEGQETHRPAGLPTDRPAGQQTDGKRSRTKVTK